MRQKQWKQFRDTNYWVSNDGEVKKITIKTKETKKGIVYTTVESPRKASDMKIGYKSVKMDGKAYYLHRVVAEAFIPNPNNLKTVNHKNEDKTDNRIENLEWMSVGDNLRYSNNKKIKMVCPVTGKIEMQFESAIEAAEWLSKKRPNTKLKTIHSAICNCATGVIKKVYGYKWTYGLTADERKALIEKNEQVGF